LLCASVPANVTWKPVLLNAPLPKPATVAVAPEGRSGASAAWIPAAVKLTPFTIGAETAPP
jgi:hypothetical protein